MRTVFILFIGLCVSTACQSPRAGLSNYDTSPFQRYRNLADALRIYGGITVSGTGLNQKVTLSRNGAAQVEPLFIVNGFSLGNNYQAVNRSINMAEVQQIKVLRNLNELAQYGAQSHGGVILITTAKSKILSQTPANQSRQIVVGSR